MDLLYGVVVLALQLLQLLALLANRIDQFLEVDTEPVAAAS